MNPALQSGQHFINEAENILSRDHGTHRTHVAAFGTWATRTVSNGRSSLGTPECSDTDTNLFARMREPPTKSETYWRGDRFPRSLRESLVTQHESVVLLNPGRLGLSIFEASVWGSLFYGTAIEGQHSDSHGIHVGEFAGTILLFLRHAAGVIKTLGYSGSLRFAVSLTAVSGKKWLYNAGGWLEPRAGSALDDSIEFSIDETSDALLSSSDELASSILRVALFSMGWPGAVNRAANIQNLIAAGYMFNGWERSK